MLELTQDPAIRKGAQDNILRAQAKLVEQGGSSPQAQGVPPGFGPISERARAMRPVCRPASFIAKLSPFVVT